MMRLRISILTVEAAAITTDLVEVQPFNHHEYIYLIRHLKRNQIEIEKIINLFD